MVEIKDLKQMSDEDIFKLQNLVNMEASDREMIAEYTDRFRDLFADAKEDGIALGVYNVATGELIKARDRDCLFVGKY